MILIVAVALTCLATSKQISKETVMLHWWESESNFSNKLIKVKLPP